MKTLKGLFHEMNNFLKVLKNISELSVRERATIIQKLGIEGPEFFVKLLFD
jgi:hypothetical protein